MTYPKYQLAVLFCSLIFTGCKEEVLPKPKAQLRLEYSAPETAELETDNFIFEYNEQAQVKTKNPNSLTLKYPEMKGEVFINYRKVDDNIEKLLSDAQKLSYEHSVKADGILEQPFVNEENQVYGMFYEVSGNAASQAQFYITDSTEHFLTGSLYFMSRPNYDSIYPAAAYLQNDIRGIMETLRWKE
ncbi:MAG: gliding motility lipoprotein GldD [Pricia sp.]